MTLADLWDKLAQYETIFTEVIVTKDEWLKLAACVHINCLRDDALGFYLLVAYPTGPVKIRYALAEAPRTLDLSK